MITLAIHLKHIEIQEKTDLLIWYLHVQIIFQTQSSEVQNKKKKKTHPNIRSINTVINRFGCSSFTFQFLCIDKTVENINGLDHEKTYTFEVSDILFKIIKENPDSVAFL